jgi:hypothetical protein
VQDFLSVANGIAGFVAALVTIPAAVVTLTGLRRKRRNDAPSDEPKEPGDQGGPISGE